MRFPLGKALRLAAFASAPLLLQGCGGGGDSSSTTAVPPTTATTTIIPPAVVKPHIVMVLVDDFGWANVGYHSPNNPEVQTPNIDALVHKEGIELNRHYVHFTCTPTRSSFQTGRLGAHVQLTLAGPCNPEAGVPRNMTGIAERMREGGYETHLVGKWDCGMATPTHTPAGRGYDTSLFYFSHGNWAWTKNEWQGSYVNQSFIPACKPGDCGRDMWDGNGPVKDLATDTHEEYLFRDRFTYIVEQNAASKKPLFLLYAPKLVHYPLQAPVTYQDKFSKIINDEPHRMVYSSMVNFLDDQIGALTDALKKNGQWENTLFVLSTDNGGYIKEVSSCDVKTEHGTACYNGESGASNYPLRGGKYSHYEGGVRGNAFVSGGALPKAVRGSKLDEIIHVADWYKTFSYLAGVDPTDRKAAASGLPPIDSLDMWPLISGQTKTSPRTDVFFDKDMMISGRYKVITNDPEVSQSGAGWAGPTYPNASSAGHEVIFELENCTTGCLYDVVADPEERQNLATSKPDILVSLIAKKQELTKTILQRHIGHDDPNCMQVSVNRWGGFLGPWLELDDMATPPSLEAVVV